MAWKIANKENVPIFIFCVFVLCVRQMGLEQHDVDDAIEYVCVFLFFLKYQ